MPGKKGLKRKPVYRSKKRKNVFIRLISLFMGLAVLLTIGLAISAPSQNGISKIASPQDLGTFTGVLPCADCSGIRTSITFSLSQDEKSPHVYSQTDSYIGKGIINNSGGTWRYTTNPSMPDAIIIELTEDNSHSKMYYMVVNKDTIELLDQNKNPIKNPPIPVILTKSKN